MVQKKVCIFIAILCLLSSIITPVSAEKNIPSTGIILFDDFENYEAGDVVGRLSDGTGPWTRRLAYAGVKDNNTFWQISASPYDNYADHLLYDFEQAGYGLSQINSGKLLYEYDLYFPNAGVLEAGVRTGHYMMTYSADYDSVYPTKNKAYLSYSQYTEDEALIWFPVTGVAYPSDTPLDNAQPLTFDTWHRISHILDFEKGTVDHYVNGQYVDSFQDGADRMMNYYPVKELCIYIWAKNLTSDSPNVYMDNFKMERLSGNEPFTVSIEKQGSNYIDLHFNRTTNLIILTKEDFSLKALGGTKTSPKKLTVNGSTIRLEFDEFAKNTPYELYINKEIKETINSEKTIPYGTKLSFLTEIEPTKTVILDENFDTNFPFDSNDQRYSQNGWTMYCSTVGGETISTTVEPAWADIYSTDYWNTVNDWTFITITDPLATDKGNRFKAIEDTLDEGNIMEFDLGATNRAEGSQTLVIPFNNEKPVTNGILEVEFEAGYSVDNYNHRLAFGLRNTKDVPTDYSYPLRWSPATIFGSFSHYTLDSKTITAATEFSAHASHDVLYSPYHIHCGCTDRTEKRGTVYDLLESVNVTDIANMAKIKITIDLDQKNFEIFYNGQSLGKKDYLPGEIQGGTFDAFTITDFVHYNPHDNPDTNLYLDNVTVTHKVLPTMLTTATFEDLNGKEIDTENVTIPAGTKKVTFGFNKEMDDVSVASNIMIAGDDGTNYTVSTQGKTVVIDFPDCLKPNTTYTITLAKELCDINDNQLADDIVYTLKTDQGEIFFGSPCLKSGNIRLVTTEGLQPNQELTAELTVINTTQKPVTAFLFMAGYTKGQLKSIQSKPLSSSVQEPVLTTTFIADNHIVNADTVKLFLVDSSTLSPLTKPTLLKKNDTATLSLTSATPQGYMMNANLYNNKAPTVETADGKTGWRLKPASLNESYIKVDVEDGFLYDLNPEDTITVTVGYYDDSYSGFSLLYNDQNGKLQSQFVQMTGKEVQGHKTAVFTLYDASFDNNSLLHGDDFRIITNDSEFATDAKNFMGTAPYDVLITDISVTKETTKSPFDITVGSNKAGNVFFDDDPINFTVTLKDVSSTGGYTEGLLQYTVYNYEGINLLAETTAFTNNTANIQIPTLPFGVYTIKLTTIYDQVEQSKIVDFARSPEAPQPNDQFGTCLHASQEYYSFDDIKNMLDLVKSAGFGLARTGGGMWYQTEPAGDGKYAIPEKELYAYQYTHELGIDGLMLLGHENPYYAENDHPQYPYWLTKEENRKAYAGYCAYVVSELKDYVEYFGISGEFNLHGPGGWHPFDQYWSNHNPDNYIHYYNLVKDSYEAIRKANPKAVMINGIVGRYEEEWIQECFDLGIMDYSDGFSIDIYDFVAKPEYKTTLTTPISQFYNQVKSQHPTKAAWITENGWPTREVSFSHYLNVPMATELEQAKWYARAMALYSDKEKIDKFMFYAFHNNNVGYFWQEYNFGIVYSHDYRTPFAAKPAYIAVAAFNTLVGDATFCGNVHESNSGLYEYKFINHAGEEIIMFWREENVSPYSRPFITDAPSVEVYDMYGNKSLLNDPEEMYIQYEPTPQYIKPIYASK